MSGRATLCVCTASSKHAKRPGRRPRVDAMHTPTFLRRMSALFVVAVLLSTPALAQGKWWQSDHRFFRELALTQDQSKRLEEIFQAAVPTLKTHKKTLDEAET